MGSLAPPCPKSLVVLTKIRGQGGCTPTSWGRESLRGLGGTPVSGPQGGWGTRRAGSGLAAAARRLGACSVGQEPWEVPRTRPSDGLC